MLKLDAYLTLNKDAILSSNLCGRFSKEDLDRIGDWVYEGYRRDKQSRYKWERRNEAGMDLAMQLQKDKNFPWPGCSNVAFPLVTIAALQFQARAYAALVDGVSVAKARVIGPDPTGGKSARAERISCHMSWQVLEQDKSWEEQHERMLINLPIVGTAFKKSYYSPGKGHNSSELVLARDLVFDYWSKSVEECPRKTHVIPMFRNDLHERMGRETFRDVSGEAWYGQPPAQQSQGMQQTRTDGRKGQSAATPDETTPYICLEQHVNVDLDNDGYAEPYIITIEETSRCVLRIVTGFDREDDIERTKAGKVIMVRAMQYFTKYGFIPSPDGGVLDVGFGVLLGPLNEATNSLVNLLIDAGNVSVTAGGFLGRGAKIRGGVYTFSPLEWKRVDSSGDDLRKNVFPLPVREPSAVLFNLLSLLINYVNRVAGTTDPMVGENPGQNTPAETTRTMVNEGMKIYSARFKCVWRCMKDEFKKLYILNGLYMPDRMGYGDKGQYAKREDYLGNPEEVCPAADPNITSEGQAMQQALAVKQAAMSTPGYDHDAVERFYLKSLKVPAPDTLYVGVAKTGMPKDVKLQIAELKAQGENQRLMQERQQFIIQMQLEQRMNDAEIAKIAAEIENMKATTEGDKDDRQIGLLNAILGAMKLRNETLTKHIDVQIKKLELEKAHVEARADNAGDVPRLAAPSSNGGGTGALSAQASGGQG